MRKLTLIPLTILLVAALAACGGATGADPAAQSTPTPTADINQGPFTLDDVSALLTMEEVETHFAGLGPWVTDSINSYEMAANVDPTQVVNIDSWWGWTYEVPSGEFVTISVMDFTTVDAAIAHTMLVAAEAIAVPQRIADEAYIAEGGGLIILVGRQADKLFMVNAGSFEEGAIDAALVTTVAELVASRL
jgi:hypothetical protein